MITFKCGIETAIEVTASTFEYCKRYTHFVLCISFTVLKCSRRNLSSSNSSRRSFNIHFCVFFIAQMLSNLA